MPRTHTHTSKTTRLPRAKEKERDRDRDKDREKAEHSKTAQPSTLESVFREREKDREKEREKDRESDKEREKDKTDSASVPSVPALVRQESKGKDKNTDRDRDREKDKDWSALPPLSPTSVVSQKDKDKDREKEREKDKDKKETTTSAKTDKEKDKDKPKEKEKTQYNTQPVSALTSALALSPRGQPSVLSDNANKGTNTNAKTERDKDTQRDTQREKGVLAGSGPSAASPLSLSKPVKERTIKFSTASPTVLRAVMDKEKEKEREKDKDKGDKDREKDTDKDKDKKTSPASARPLTATGTAKKPALTDAPLSLSSLSSLSSPIGVSVLPVLPLSPAPAAAFIWTATERLTAEHTQYEETKKTFLSSISGCGVREKTYTKIEFVVTAVDRVLPSVSQQQQQHYETAKRRIKEDKHITTTEDDLADRWAFACVSHTQCTTQATTQDGKEMTADYCKLIDAVCRSSLSPSVCAKCASVSPTEICDEPGSCGNHTKGVYLYRHADKCFSQLRGRAARAGEAGCVVMCKLFTGKRLQFLDTKNKGKQAPSPGYHAHEAIKTGDYFIFDSAQVLPCFVVHWKATPAS